MKKPNYFVGNTPDISQMVESGFAGLSCWGNHDNTWDDDDYFGDEEETTESYHHL